MSEQNSATASRSVAVTGTVQAALGSLCFSFTFPATRWALDGFGPWTLTGLRGTLAALLAVSCLLAAGARIPPRSAWPGLAAVAAGCVIGFPVFSTLALQASSTAHSAVVIGLLPLGTAAAAALRSGSRPPRPFWLAALAGAAVVLAFTVQQSHGAVLTAADLLLFAGLAVCSFGYAEGGRLARTMPGWQVIAWGLVAALPVMAVTAALGPTAEPVHWTWRGVTGLAWLGVVSQFAGFVVWYRGMAAIGIPRASQLQLAQPLLTICWAVLLLAEPLPGTAVPAALAVVACIVVTQRTGSGTRSGRRASAQETGQIRDLRTECQAAPASARVERGSERCS